MSLPGPPNITELPFASPNMLEFEWGPPLNPNGTILGYRFTINGSQTILGPSIGYYAATGLTNGLTYYTSLEASNTNGWGTPANFRNYQPGSEPIVGPSTFEVVTTGCNASFRWTPPSILPDAQIFWYMLYAEDAFYKNTLSYTANGLTQSNYIVKLTDYGEYYKYTNYATNCPGWSPPVVIEPVKQRGNPLWATRMGGSSNQINTSISIDNDNNVIVVGSFVSTMSIYNYSSAPVNGGEVGTSLFGYLPNGAATLNDIFITKYTSSGSVLWVSRIGTAGEQITPIVTTDNSNNIYVCNSTSGTSIRFSSYNSVDTVSTIVLTEDGNMGLTSTNNDITLAKYNSSGVFQWATRMGGNDFETNPYVVTDTLGNVYVTGRHATSINVMNFVSINSTTKAITLSTRCATGSSLGSYDYFLVQYSPSGFANWVTKIGSAGNETDVNLATDSQNNIYIAGEYAGTLTINNYSTITGTTLYVSTFGKLTNSGTDTFLAKYNSTGIVQWATRFGGTGGETAPYLATDSLDNIFITYRFTTAQTTLFNGGNTIGANDIINLTAFGTFPASTVSDTCLAKYDSSGQGIWATRVSLSTPTFICTDPSGNIYLTGAYIQSNQPLINNFVSTSGGGAINTSLYARMTSSIIGTSNDTYLIKYNTVGIAQWATRINGVINRDESASVIKCDLSGNLYIAGQYNGSSVVINKPTLAPSVGNIDNSNISLANGTLAPYGTLPNEGLYDVYIVKLET